MRVEFRREFESIGSIEFDGKTMSYTIPEDLWKRIEKEGASVRKFKYPVLELEGPYFPVDGAKFMHALTHQFKNFYLRAVVVE